MKKLFIMCTVSAVLGAFFAINMTQNTSQPTATAQDRQPPRRVPSLEPAGVIPASTGVSRTASISDSDEYTPEERVHIAVYDAVNQSVVNITTRSIRPDAFFLFQEQAIEGAGSGFVLDADGHILTNHHVVDGAREIHVTLHNGNTYDAGLVGQDPQNDIAVLRISAPKETLRPVNLGESRRLKVGQKVFAIGNPLGLERTLTIGIVSSLNRTLPSRTNRTMKSIIQIDAALNRGNSGGPLLNSRGQLIGMNTAIASPSGAGENIGIGFAIPVSTIQRVVPQLIEHGRVIRPDLGLARVFETGQGLVIAVVSPGGPAERAGLRGFRVIRERRQRGAFIYEETRVDRDYADMIVEIDGKRITTADELLTIVESKKPGDEVTVTVIRDGQKENVTVLLGENSG